MDYSKITLGELLSSKDDIIKRNAVSILKRYQSYRYMTCSWCGINQPESNLAEYCVSKCRHQATGKK